MEYVPCIGNSSYSFWRILLKLYRCFKDGLKICILFFQNPEIIFYHFFRIFNLDIFRALILQICIWSMYLVSATPPTVFGESFWNFTDVLRMVWRYAYCFFRILKLFLSLFTHFYFRHFSSPYTTDMYMEYVPCIGNSSYSFWSILLKLYRCFKDGLEICILFFRILKLFFITFFRIFNLRHFSSPYTTDMYMEYIPCIGNSSYSFWRILLKLYSCFQDGLKICILFSQDPEIIFFAF